MSDKVFLDSNVFLYGFCNKDQNKQRAAKNLLLDDATISVQVLNEVSVNMLRKLGLNELQVRSFIDSSFNRYEVIDLSKAVFVTASEIRSEYSISYYDSVIVAAALASNCTLLYSEDLQDHLIIRNRLQIANPFIS